MLAAPLHATLAWLAHGNPADFSWTRWEIHASVLIGCLLFAGAYLAGVGPLRRRYRLADRVERWQVVAFLSGVAVLFVALNGPIHDLSDNFLFSAHMVQHMLITMVAPPLWLIGTPAWLLRPLLRRRGVWPVARVLTHPLVAFIVYNVVFIGWHFPALYNAALESHAVHIVQHLMFMGAAVLMWWPVADPLPELARLSSPLQMIYLFAFGVPMSVVSALITLSENVLYPWYEAAPRIWTLTALDDQQLGGLIMWIPGGLVFWAAITIVFFRWWRREQAEDARERERLLATSHSASR